MVDAVPTITSRGNQYSTKDGTLIPVSGSEINLIGFYEAAIQDEAYTNLILEEIGGRELSTLVRHQTLTGGAVAKNTPIENVTEVLLRNSPINISPNINSVTDYFDTFPMLLSQYIPTKEELDAENTYSYQKEYVYFEPATNTIIFNVINTNAGERVQVEFVVFDSLKNDTIYT
jgi:hypothetical protein